MRQSTPVKVSARSGAESPTTARELDFDDDLADVGLHGGGAAAAAGSMSDATPKPGSGDDIGPPQPPRPVDARLQAETTLKEAFPSIDAAVIRAVLMASGGSLEPAFNALLGEQAHHLRACKTDRGRQPCPIRVRSMNLCRQHSLLARLGHPWPRLCRHRPRRTSSRRTSSTRDSWPSTTTAPAPTILHGPR